MQPLQLSDEILVLALLPLCPLSCVLQLAAVARRAGPGQLTTHDLLRRCVDLRERVLTALLPVLWEGLRCPPFRGVHVPLLQFGGQHSGDFAHAVAARRGLHPRRNVVRTLPGNSAAPNPPTSRGAPPHTARRLDLPRRFGGLPPPVAGREHGQRRRRDPGRVFAAALVAPPMAERSLRGDDTRARLRGGEL